MDPVLNKAVSLIAKAGWQKYSLTDVAVELNRPLYKLQELFTDKYGVVQALHLHVNAEMESVRGEPTENLHDWLFELFMDRFDALEEVKPALQELHKYLFTDVTLAKLIACNLHEWMRSLASHIPEKDAWATSLRPATLCLIYAAAMEAWLQDDTVDASHTMATLDKRLGDFESILNSRYS